MMQYRSLNRSLAALTAVLTTSACSFMPESTAEDFLAASPAAVSNYQMGKEDLAAGNYGMALGYFGAAVERDPTSIAALNGEAVALIKLDRDDDAAAIFERALKIDDGAAVTLTNYANFLARRGDHARAAALLARLDPPSGRATAAMPQPPAPASMTKDAMAAAGPATKSPLSAFSAAPAPFSKAALAIEPEPVGAPALSIASAPSALAVKPTPSVDPAPPEAPAPTITPVPNVKSALTIWNGSGQYRLARRLQHYLSGQGIHTGKIADATRFDRTQSILFCHAQSRQAAEAVRRILPVSVKLVVLTSSGDRMELMAGRDLNNFDAKLAFAAPPAKGSAR